MPKIKYSRSKRYALKRAKRGVRRWKRKGAKITKTKIRGWKLVTTNRKKGFAQWRGVGHSGLMSIAPTGKRGILTKGYQVVVGYALDLYPAKGSWQRIVNEKFEPLLREAIRWMKKHPKGY